MTPNLPEAGYTPANLRSLIESRGWTQNHAASMIGAESSTLRRWLMPADHKQHRDMPLCKWLALLAAE